MDSEQKIREFLNNEDTKEIVNFLFDLPTPAFKFWGGLIKQSYKSKILEGWHMGQGCGVCGCVVIGKG